MSKNDLSKDEARVLADGLMDFAEGRVKSLDQVTRELAEPTIEAPRQFKPVEAPLGTCQSHQNFEHPRAPHCLNWQVLSVPQAKETPTLVQARQWCDERRKDAEIGKAIQNLQSWAPDCLATVVRYLLADTISSPEKPTPETQKGRRDQIPSSASPAESP